MAAPSTDPATAEIREAVGHLTRAMWELRTLSDGRASGTLSQDAMTEIRAAADVLGIGLP